MKIAAALIAGNDVKKNPKDFIRCVQSLNGYIDKVFVSYNGDGDPPEQIPNAPFQIYRKAEWLHDFADARNHSFQNIYDYETLSGETFDWIMWLDTDDTLENGQNLSSLIESLDENTQGVMLRYDYSVDKETEQVLAVQWRERLFRRDLKLKWVYPIHEICLGENTEIPLLDGTNQKIKDLVDRDVWVYSCTEDGEIKPALAKNIRLSKKNAKTIKIKLDNGLSFSCTADHKIMLLDGSFCEAGNLSISDSIMPFRRGLRELRPNKFYEHLKHPNLIQGDKHGWEPTHRMVYRETNQQPLAGSVVHHKDKNTLNNSPSNLEEMTLADHCRLHKPQDLEALFVGSVRRWNIQENKDAASYRILLRNEEWRESGKAQEIFKKISESKRLDLPEEEIISRYLGGETISSIARSYGCSRRPIKDRLKKADLVGQNHKIVSIQDDYEQDVYDLTVDDFENFAITAGIFVHNCRFTPGAQLAKRDEVWIRHWREVDYEATETRERNRSILVKARRENPNQPRFCVPLDSEILTRDGFKSYDQVKIGDETIGYNFETQKNEWTKITDIYHGFGPLITIGNNRWNARCTPEHRWVAEKRIVENGIRKYKDVFVDSTSKNYKLKLSAPFVGGNSEITPDEASLVAWLKTDGYIRRGYGDKRMNNPIPSFVATVAQKKSRGVEELDSLVQRLPITKRRPDKIGCYTYYVNPNYIRALWDKANLDNISLSDFVLNLSKESLDSFVNSCFIAEGVLSSENNGKVFSQNSGEVLDAIVLAGYLYGHRVSVRKHVDYNDVHIIRYCSDNISSSCEVINDNQSENIWCPKTELGTWTMKQNNSICLTGNTYYLANEVYAEAALAVHNGEPAEELINAAIKTYEDFIPNAPSPDDAYIAVHQIAELHRMNKDFMPAVETDLQALMIHPTWPDAMVGISQAYMELQDWDKCIFWADACLKLAVKEETTQVREPLNHEYIPRLLKGIALENKGFLQEALQEYEEIAHLKLTGEIDEKIDDVIKKMALPPIDSGEKFKFERKKYFGSQPKKSICFFTSTLFEPWHPDLVKEGGIGGSETAVMEVAKRFAADGWRTVVFGTPGDHWGMSDDGVEYWPTDEFLATEEFTIFVSSRTPQVFDADIRADITILWCHDVNVGPTFDGEWGNRVQNIDFIAGLTDWHINHMSNLYGIPVEKFIRIPNGIDLTRFESEEPIKRQKNKLVWSSSPDRGIDIILSMWPEIKEIAPDAELHVYYGWESIDKIIEIHPQNNLVNFKRAVINIIEHLGGEDAGIYWHGRIGQEQLAKELMTCDIWPYTTEFLETFCITALEMQAAGVVPITSNLAALKETSMGVKISGWPNNVTYRKEFLNRLREQVNNPLTEEYRKPYKMFAAQYDWDKVYRDYWNFDSVLNPAGNNALEAVA